MIDNFSLCNVQIAIRKWENRVRDDLEFRCFVFDGKLTAISQYNHYCYFPHLGNINSKQTLNLLKKIKISIIKYWNDNIKDCVPYSEYIVDIAVLEGKKLNTALEMNDSLDCVVIELNPYATTTGAGLFDWRRDEKQLKYGLNMDNDEKEVKWNGNKSIPIENDKFEEIELRVHTKPVLSDEFVEHWMEELLKCKQETPWTQFLDQIEAFLKRSDGNSNETADSGKGVKKPDCIVM